MPTTTPSQQSDNNSHRHRRRRRLSTTMVGVGGAKMDLKFEHWMLGGRSDSADSFQGIIDTFSIADLKRPLEISGGTTQIPDRGGKNQSFTESIWFF